MTTLIESKAKAFGSSKGLAMSMALHGGLVALALYGTSKVIVPPREKIDILSTPHKLFADAVRTALLNTRYRPADAGGKPVRQLVEQSFQFKLNQAD